MAAGTGSGQVAVRVVIDRSGLGAELNRANDQIVDGAEKAGEQAGKAISGGMKAGVAAAGAAAGVAITASLMDALNREAEGDKMAAALALSPDEAKKAAEASANVYKAAWGQSTEEVSLAVRAIMSQVDGMRGASQEDLEAVSASALALADTFQFDVSEAANAAGTMIKTGMAKDATEAFDIITRGFQSGADKRQDYLDTLTEYSTLFRQLGIDGATATGLLSQGLDAGARDADQVADALKELSIRAVDGSATTREAYALLGMDADDMTARFAAGGESASAALADVLNGLRNMKDPADKTRAAVGLLGGQAENLGAALYALDPTTAAQGLGEVSGAAGQFKEQVGDNAQTQIEGYTRKIQDFGYSAVEATGTWGAMGAALAGFAPSVLSVLGPLAMMSAAWGGVAASVLRATGAWIANTAAMVANRVAALASAAASVIVRVATAAWTAVQWLLNTALLANPITWIVLAVVALIAAIVLAYKHSETFRNIVQAVGRAAAAAFGWVVDAVKKVWEWIGKAFGWVKQNWPMLLAILTGPIGMAVAVIVKHWDAVLAFFKAIPGKIAAAFKTVADGITAPFRAAFNTVAKLWNSTIGKLAWTVPDWVPALGGKTVAAPRLPELQGLATGGDVVRAGAFLVGENGPEVVNLPAGAAVTPNGGGGGTTNVTINVNGGNPREVEAAIDRALARNNAALARGFRAQLA